MSTAVIEYDGDDITPAVIISSCRFTAAVRGVAARSKLRVRDDGHTYDFVTGKEITLDVDGIRQWGGYVTNVRRGFFSNGTDKSPGDLERYFELDCVDYNALFQRRVLYNKSTPTKMQLTTYPAGTHDDDILLQYIDDHLDLTDDGLTTDLIQHVGTPSTDSKISGAGGWTWDQFMRFITRNTGAIYYISPEKQIALVDEDTQDAPFGLTDNPIELTFEDDFNRVVVDGLGGPWTLSDFGTDPEDASVDGNTVVCSDEIDYNIPWNVTGGSIQFDFHVPADPNEFAYYYCDLLGRRTVGVQFTRSYLEAFSNGDGTWFSGAGTGTGYEFTPDPDEWYTARGYIDPDGVLDKFKLWKRSDPEPLEWQDEQPPFLSGAISPYDPTLYLFADGENSLLDNLKVWPDEVEFPSFGCREIEIDSEGAEMRNDALAWGVGQGSANAVFHRSQDAASIAAHGRWQVGAMSQVVWRQETINRIAQSYVYGSPQNHRGGKDDQRAVRCAIFRPGMRAGMKVPVRSEVFNYLEVLPIREMTITFPSPTNPRYDLTMSHEIDPPWSTFEFWFPGWDLPDFDFDFDIDIPGFEIPGFDFCAPSGCDGCIEHFVGLGEWGESTIQCAVWTDAGSTPNASVTRQAGVGRMIAEPHGFATRYVELPRPPEDMGDYEVLVKVVLHLGDHPPSFNAGAAEFSVLISDGTGPNSIHIQDFVSGSSPYGGAQHYTIGGVYSGSSGGGGGGETVLHTFALTKGNNTGAAEAVGVAGDGDEIYIKLNYATNGVSVKTWKVGDVEPGGSGQVQTGNTLPTCPFLILRLVARDSSDLGFGTSEQAVADIDFIQVTSGIECSDIVTVASAMGLLGGDCFDDFDIDDTDEWPGWVDGGPEGASSPDNVFTNGGFGIYEGTDYHYIWKNGIVLTGPVYEQLIHVNVRFTPDTGNFEFATGFDGGPTPPESSTWDYVFIDQFNLNAPFPEGEPFTVSMALLHDGQFGSDRCGLTGPSPDAPGNIADKVALHEDTYVEFDFWLRHRVDYDLHTSYSKVWDDGTEEPAEWDLELTDLDWTPPEGFMFAGMQISGDYLDTLNHSSLKIYSWEVTEGCGGGDPCFDGIGTPGFQQPSSNAPIQGNLEEIDTPPGEDGTSTWFRVRNIFRAETVYLNGMVLRRGIDYAPHYDDRWIEIFSSVTINPGDTVYATYTVWLPGDQEIL